MALTCFVDIALPLRHAALRSSLLQQQQHLNDFFKPVRPTNFISTYSEQHARTMLKPLAVQLALDPDHPPSAPILHMQEFLNNCPSVDAKGSKRLLLPNHPQTHGPSYIYATDTNHRWHPRECQPTAPMHLILNTWVQPTMVAKDLQVPTSLRRC